MNKSITGGALALFLGFILAMGTAYGVVKSQESAGNAPVTGPVSYGTN